MRSRRGYEKVPSDEKEAEDLFERRAKKKSGLFKSSSKQAFIPEQFKIAERPIPLKSIAFAAFLFILGTILLLCGTLIHTGHLDNQVKLKTHTKNEIF